MARCRARTTQRTARTSSRWWIPSPRSACARCSGNDVVIRIEKCLRVFHTGAFDVISAHLGWGRSLTDTSSADCAPNQLFQLFRCSAWLILQKQSTGLFLPKRSCSRAAPLRRRTELPLRESPVFRSASSDCAPNQLFQLFRYSVWLLLTTHRTSLSGCSGVSHGLFSMNSPLDCSF